MCSQKLTGLRWRLIQRAMGPGRSLSFVALWGRGPILRAFAVRLPMSNGPLVHFPSHCGSSRAICGTYVISSTPINWTSRIGRMARQISSMGRLKR